MKTLLAALIVFAAALVFAPRAAAQLPDCNATYLQAAHEASSLTFLVPAPDSQAFSALTDHLNDAASLVRHDETAYASNLCSVPTLADLRALTARLQARLAQLRAQHLADRIAQFQTAIAEALRNPLFR